jgi:hypothetical protein
MDSLTDGTQAYAPALQINILPILYRQTRRVRKHIRVAPGSDILKPQDGLSSAVNLSLDKISLL